MDKNLTLLCVDDSEEIQLLVKTVFAHLLNVVSAYTIYDGMALIKTKSIDLILLDLGLPDGDGLNLINELKENQFLCEIPIIVVSSRCHIQDKVMSFRLGADDYLCKPFNPLELKVRVECRMKQKKALKESQQIIHSGNLSIHQLELTTWVMVDNELIWIDLTTTEFKILCHLAKHKNQVLSREQIINATWKYGYNISDRTIDSHICRIRKKIHASDQTILAVHNVGYKLADYVTIQETPHLSLKLSP